MDDKIVKLISNFSNLPIYDYDENRERDISLKTGIPPVSFIGEIIFHFIYDDIDRLIEERLPQLQFARYKSEILIPIYHKKSLMIRIWPIYSMNALSLTLAMNVLLGEINRPVSQVAIFPSPVKVRLKFE